ncbi:MAG: peptidase C45, partial [Caldanaerobacter sp.]
ELVETLKPGESHPKLPVPLPKDTLIISGEDRYMVILERIKENYGKINVEKMIEIIKRPAAMEENLHNAIFVPEDLKMWLAVAADPNEKDYQACYQKYYEYDFLSLLKLCNV